MTSILYVTPATRGRVLDTHTDEASVASRIRSLATDTLRGLLGILVVALVSVVGVELGAFVVSGLQAGASEVGALLERWIGYLWLLLGEAQFVLTGAADVLGVQPADVGGGFA